MTVIYCAEMYALAGIGISLLLHSEISKAIDSEYTEGGLGVLFTKNTYIKIAYTYFVLIWPVVIAAKIIGEIQNMPYYLHRLAVRVKYIIRKLKK